jgi:hypothetical protein
MMKSLIISALLAVPAAVFAQEARPELTNLPALDEQQSEPMESVEPVQRPDADRIISETSSALRLSSKQEERISAAVNRKTEEFDKLMKDYDKSAVEEKKWRYKMNDARHAMQKINREMPDTVREFLDDEQRQSFDGIVAAKKRPAAPPTAVETAAPAANEGAVKPLKKKRVLRRKKLPAGGAMPAGSSGSAAPAAAVPAADEEAGSVMVDKEPAAVQPAPRKKRVLRKKVAAAAAPAAPAQAPAEDIMADEPEPAGAKAAGKEAPAEDEGGSYP